MANMMLTNQYNIMIDRKLGYLFTYLIVLVSIVSNEGSGPESVESISTDNNISVVELMVVAKPRSDKSPESLDSWVSTKSGGLHWLTAYFLFISIRLNGYKV